MEDLGVFRPPHPDYFLEHPDHCWEAGKLGMDLDEVFTTLPRQFNLMAIPILDRDAFRLETQHVSSVAHDRTEFFELLQVRLEARRKEQLDMMMHTLSLLAWDPRQIDETGAKHWGHAMHIYRSKSFDTIVRFLAGFLRDADPSSNTAISAAVQNEHLTPQSDAPSPSQSTVSVPSNEHTEIRSRPLSSVSTTNKSQAPRTASTSTVPRTRKRSATPATSSLADDDDDEDEMRPSKKIRLEDDIAEPKTALPPTLMRKPTSPRARRFRKDQPSVPRSPKSTTTTATVAPSTSSRLRPSADEASGSDSSKRLDGVSTSQKTSLGTSGQHAGSAIVGPDTNDEVDNTRAKRDKVLFATGTATRQRSCRPGPPKGKAGSRQPPSSSSRNKPSSKVQKSTPRPVPQATRTTARGSRSRGAVLQTRSSQRLTRQASQGGQFFHELDSHGKARSVVAWP